MNATAIIWLTTFVFLLCKSFKRPVYCCCAYLMTFFAAPQFWWWGYELTQITMRWNLFTALALLVCVVLNWSRGRQFTKADSLFFGLMFGYVGNAFFVNSFLASSPHISGQGFDLLWKAVGLSYLIRCCVSDADDLQVFLTSVLLGCAYVGYEVVINNRGEMINGRLELSVLPAGQGANALAAIMSCGLPIAAYLLLAPQKSWKLRLLALGCAPFVLDTVLRCNSRGTFLGLLVTGAWFLCTARSDIRGRVYGVALVGCLAILTQARSDSIWDRFSTTFAEQEERDNSAQQRLDSWAAGLRMIRDYPLGSGAEAAFKSPRGNVYQQAFRPGDELRSIHNGYLDIAAGWGVQGFVLMMLALSVSFATVYKATRQVEDKADALLGLSLQAIFLSQLVPAFFTSILDSEQYLWISVCNLSYAAVTRSESSQRAKMDS